MRGASVWKSRLLVPMREYFTVWTLGSLLGFVFWVCWLRGDIKVYGYRRLLRSAWHGRLMIAANHPSLVEPLLIAALGWPMSMAFRRYFFWSMPDDALFPAKLRWLYAFGRCIVVDRSAKDKHRNRAAIRQAIKLLRSGNVVTIHPEGGRTRKWSHRGVKLLTCGERQISEVKPEVIALAKASNCQILTLWVGMSPVRERELFENFSLSGLFRRDLGPIELRFDHEPYSIQTPFDPPAEKEKLETLLLTKSA